MTVNLIPKTNLAAELTAILASNGIDEQHPLYPGLMVDLTMYLVVLHRQIKDDGYQLGREAALREYVHDNPL